MKPLSQILEKQLDVNELHALTGRMESHYSFGAEAKEPINRYTGRSFEVNSHLWKQYKEKNPYKKVVTPNGAGKDLPHEELNKHIGQLDKITHTHKTPEDMEVYSKTIHDPRELKGENGMVHHPAFLSTSLSKRTVMNLPRNNVRDAEGHTHHHILEIHVPKGSPGAYIQHHSEYNQGGREFLLPRGSNLRHIETQTQDDNNSKQHYYHHKLEFVND